jgi:excisionase family DNA binding protein
MLTLGQAARLTGTSKTTLTRAIKAGRLSATRRDDGGYQIDPAELARVFDVATATPETGTATGNVVHQATPGATPATPAADTLQAELAGVRQLLKYLEAQVDDLRHDRDGWRQQAEAAQRLLTHSQAAVPSPVAAAPARAWWQRLAG